MSERVTPLRGGVHALPDRVVDLRSPAEKIVELQKALDAEVGLVEEKLVHDLSDMAHRLSRASDLPLKPGIRDEFRRLSEHIGNVVTRVESLRGRA